MATLADIRGLARVYSDQDASDFPTDAQYNLIINAAAQRVWYDMLKAGWPIDYSSTTVTANGSTTYPLGAGIAGVRGVFLVQGNQLFELRRINEGKRAQLLSLQGQTGQAEFYDIRTAGGGSSGMVLELLPKPPSGTYQVDRILEFQGFAIDITPWPGPAGTDELVSLKAAEMACRKESRREDAAILREDYKELLTDITDRLNWLNMKDPPQIRDVTSQRPRTIFDYPVAGPGLDF